MIDENIKFYHQMGWGGRTMIPELLDQGIGTGVIMSHKDLSWEQCHKFVSKIRSLQKEIHILFDPQLFVPRFDHERIQDYPHYSSDNITNDFITRTAEREDYINKLVETQTELQVDVHLTPSIYRPHYSSDFMRVNINLGNQYIDSLNDESSEVFLSLPLHILNLQNSDVFDEILELVTASDFQGVYLIIELEDDDKFLWRNQVQMYNLLKFLHHLVENEIEIIFGYGSQSIIPLLVSGINTFASGHFLNLRSFTLDRWTIDESIKRAKDKYYSNHLLTNIEQESDLELLFQRNLGGDYLLRIRSPSPFDDQLFSGNPPSSVQWRRNSWRHYLYHCQAITEQIQGNSRKYRYQKAIDLITSADNLFSYLENQGVQFQRRENDGSHIRAWLGALRAYQQDFV